jgi:hypothetical protein
LHGHWDVAVRRDKDDWELPVGGGKLALKLETATPRQSHVDHEAGRAIRMGIGIEKLGN